MFKLGILFAIQQIMAEKCNRKFHAREGKLNKKFSSRSVLSWVPTVHWRFAPSLVHRAPTLHTSPTNLQMFVSRVHCLFGLSQHLKVFYVWFLWVLRDLSEIQKAWKKLEKSFTSYLSVIQSFFAQLQFFFQFQFVVRKCKNLSNVFFNFFLEFDYVCNQFLVISTKCH